MIGTVAKGDSDSAKQSSASRRHGSLFRKYALLLVAVLGGVLLTNSAIEAFLGYQDGRAVVGQMQRREALAAADSIEQFVGGIEKQIDLVMQPVWAAGAGIAEERRYAYLSLLHLTPAISEISYVDSAGKERLRISRVAVDVIESQADRSREAWYLGTRSGNVYLGAVYFQDEYDPYLPMAIPDPGPNGGVTVAQVNLAPIGDIVSRIKVGRSGYAYIVDSAGLLIAHPDISQVLKKQNLAAFAQVRAALSTGSARAAALDPVEGRGLDDRPVLSSFAPIEPAGAGREPVWWILVEQPREEATAATGSFLLRKGLLLLAGSVVAVVLSLALARGLVSPIRALQAGTIRIAGGDLDQPIRIATGDELEMLANEFNLMAWQLRESRQDLEYKVEMATKELTEAVHELEALSEVSRAVSSTLNLNRALKTIVEFAVQISQSDGGIIYEFDEKTGEFLLRETEKLPPDLTWLLSTAPLRLGEGAMGQAGQLRAPVQIPDVQLDRAYERRSDVGKTIYAAGIRSLVALPLLVEDRLLGGLVVGREVPGEFPPRLIRVLEAFAGQSALAIQNARLFEEIQEKSHEIKVMELERYLPRQVAALIKASPGHNLLAGHREEVTVFFCDMRGFTSFADRAEPEHVMRFLKEYHHILGTLVDEFGGTLERFAGDAIMAYFNDPEPLPHHEEQAVRMAIQMRERMMQLMGDLEGRLGIQKVGFGIGIDRGFATLGRIGYAGRYDYAAIGRVTNRASRLCAAALDGQILITQRVYSAIAGLVNVEALGELELKGFSELERVYNVLDLK